MSIEAVFVLVPELQFTAGARLHIHAFNDVPVLCSFLNEAFVAHVTAIRSCDRMFKNFISLESKLFGTLFTLSTLPLGG